MTRRMKTTALFIGCYERFVFKYDLQEQGTKLVKTASHAAHPGPVKCLQISGGRVFSAGAGDVLRIFDAKSGTDVDALTVPEVGGVTSLSVATGMNNSASVMINGCSDGSIHFWKRGKETWHHEKRALFHKAPIYATDIHASEKLAFTADRDRNLVLWDLLSKKRGFSCRLTAEATDVQFHPFQSESYVIAYENVVSVSNLGTESAFQSWKQMADVHVVRFWKKYVFLTASDDGAIRIWDDRMQDMVLEIPDAHAARIKGLDTIAPHLCVTGASNGELKIWDLRKVKKRYELQTVASEETEARITCLALASYDRKERGKRKRGEEVFDGDAAVL